MWTLKAVKDFSLLSKSSKMFDRHQVTRSLGINYCELAPLRGEAVTHRDIWNFRADLPWRACLSSWPEAVESSPLFYQRSHFLHRHLPNCPPHCLLCLVLPLTHLLPPSTPSSTTIHPCPVLPAATPALAGLVCLWPALVVPALWRRWALFIACRSQCLTVVPDQLHGEWKVVCDECGVAMHPGAVIRHKKSFHRGGDEVVMGRFNCRPPCTFSCARAEHLKQHQKPNNKLCMLNASICTSCHELVRGSMLTHRRSKCSAKYPCLECDAAFPTKALLIHHRSDAHPDRLVVISAQWVFLVLYLMFMV